MYSMHGLVQKHVAQLLQSTEFALAGRTLEQEVESASQVLLDCVSEEDVYHLHHFDSLAQNTMALMRTACLEEHIVWCWPLARAAAAVGWASTIGLKAAGQLLAYADKCLKKLAASACSEGQAVVRSRCAWIKVRLALNKDITVEHTEEAAALAVEVEGQLASSPAAAAECPRCLKLVQWEAARTKAAVAYRAQQLEEAATQWKQAVELGRELLGPKHPDYAMSLNNLATVHRSWASMRKHCGCTSKPWPSGWRHWETSILTMPPAA